MIWHHRSLMSNKRYALQRRGVVLMVLPVVIAGGIGIIVGVTLAQYAYRSMKQMKEEDEGKKAPSNPVKGLQSIGIDIGAAFTKLALRNGDSLAVLEHRDGSYTTPSYILYDHDDISIGKLAFGKRYLKPDSTFHLLQFALGNVPKQLSQPLNIDTAQPLEFHRHSHVITPSSYYKLLVEDALRNVEAKTHLDGAHFAFAYPHFLSTQQIQSMKGVVSHECKVSATYIPDHLAVLLHMQTRLQNGSTYAIIDVGGHFTQFSVTTFNSSTPQMSDVKYTHTVFSLGMCRINDIMVNDVAAKFKVKHNIDLLQDPHAKQRLYDAIEITKQELSTQPSAKVFIPYLTAAADGSVVDLDMELSRRSLEELCSGLAQEYQHALHSLQDYAVDGVILVGGGAHIPFLQRVTSDVFKVQPMQVEQPQQAVALGAAAAEVNTSRNRQANDDVATA